MSVILKYLSDIRVVIGLAVLIVLIMIILIVQKINSGKARKQLEDLEDRYNTIKKVPLSFKLNKAVAISRIVPDAMAKVTVLSVYGEETGERVMQICLAHSYGANREENAQHTARAVRRLMNDLEIDGYYMID